MIKILLMLFVCFNCFSNDVYININNRILCEKTLLDFNINQNIKSYKGWMRTCNNDKLELYTNKPLSNKDKKDICKCFYYNYTDRDIVMLKDIK